MPKFRQKATFNLTAFSCHEFKKIEYIKDLIRQTDFFYRSGMYFALLLEAGKILSIYRDASEIFSDFISHFRKLPCSFRAPDAGA